MKRVMAYISDHVEPKIQRVSRNPWLQGVQQGILTTMPVIFIGSFVVLFQALGGMIDGFPDLDPLYRFSMGILSVLLAYLIPANIMEEKKHKNIAKEAGIAGLILYLILCAPEFGDGTLTFMTDALGNGGMFHALVAALFAAFVMNLFTKVKLFKEDSVVPDFIRVWFDTLIPMFLVLLTGWLLVYVLGIDMYQGITSVFMPLVSAGDSLIGFIVLYWFGYVFLYSFGISSWAVWPLEAAIIYTGLQANQAAVSVGEAATRLNVDGIGSYLCLGGSGATLSLAVMFFLLSKSKKNKVIGRVSLVPSIFNINEPLVYGAPIAFNGILMIPFWIAGMVVAVATWVAMKVHLIPLIVTQWDFWFAPKFVGAFVVGGMAGLLFSLVIFVVTWFIYYPFFRIYDNRCLAEETATAKTNELEPQDA
jgi:PTS system cellobiose-specific IIC component